jgi:nitroimidazol reductase NimA-like FMN-containing flavoprotein (pyridoxamine 5'-phosphate oxidase superfamily)
MLGALTRVQCEHVLKCELVGRIGCAATDKVYIIPVTYVFHDKFIYAHSKEGLKIRMMRKNPKVCFEVEARESMRDWRSVILWGRYEELKSASEQKKALKILSDHLLPFLLSESLRPVGYVDAPRQVERERKPVIYRISIDEITGRFEKSDS